MTCREMIDALFYYHSESMPEEERRCYEAHLASCPKCVAYVYTYRETVRLCQAAFKESAPNPAAEVPEELVRTIVASITSVSNQA